MEKILNVAIYYRIVRSKIAMRFVIRKNVLKNLRKIMKTKEEIFRLSGKPVAGSLHKIRANLSLIQLWPSYLNKEELQELINWLISKLDEME